jgi:hypothetical protein
MAEQSTVFRGPETPEGFLADRQRTWQAFTGATLASIIGVVIVLVGMAVFLL